MKEPKTIKGYISMIRFIEGITISDKKGFEDLDTETQRILFELAGQISNQINSIETE